MLSDAFGSDFRNHQRSNTASESKIISGHNTYRQIRRQWPEHRIFAILREPKSRLRSEIQHHYARRNEPRYHRLGHIFASMIRDGFHADKYLLGHPAVIAQCDNVLVRYLCSTVVDNVVTEEHFEQAKANLVDLDEVLLNERFARDTERLFKRFGVSRPKVRTENRRRIDHVFEDLPEEMSAFVKFDRQLYEFARRAANSRDR